MTLPLVEKIFSRCIEVGDCWEWQGAFRSCGTTPVVNLNRKIVGVRRLLLQEAGTRTAGRLATYSCGNHRCVAPWHLQALTRAQLQARTNRTSHNYDDPGYRLKLSTAARGRGKLTRDQADMIRAASGTQRDVAREFGVSQSTVSLIRRGEKWRDYFCPFSNMVDTLNRQASK